MRSFLALVLFLLVCFGVAAFGGQFTPGEWYAALEKPAWNPPGWVFAPVWTLLYAMMAVAGWVVWREGAPPDSSGWMPSRGAALGVYAVQLVLNGAWSWLFFGLQRPGLAFAEILALWLAILGTAVLFWRRKPLAGALLVPYLAWVGFAAALNLALWRLNA